MNVQIDALALKVREIKSELDALSPTAQFAAYFKKERSWKQRLAELNSLSKLFPARPSFFYWNLLYNYLCTA